MNKAIFASIYVCLFTVLVFGQVKPVEKDQSNIEKFSAKSGSLIEKRFIDIGSVKETRVKVLVLTDLISNAKVSGVKFEKDTATKYTTDTKSAFLDLDEVDGLIKSVNVIRTKVLPSTPEIYTEVVFTSRSGYSSGCYFSKGKWNAFMKLERFDNDSYEWLQPEDFETLVNLLQQAKLKMV
jgi:hypothetical protein